MDEVLVSVIVPVYNVEKYLPKCLDSIANQTYYKLEIILINDGSSDKSGEICDEYQKKDSRFIVSHGINNGVSVARNRGLDMATGDYICFIDSDDYVERDYVETLVRNMDKNDMVICGFYEDMPEGKVVRTQGKVQSLGRSDAMKLLLREDSFRGYLWNKIFRKDVIQNNSIRFRKDISVWEDVLFVYTYMRYCDIFFYNPEPKYDYVFRESSASHGKTAIKKCYSAIEAKEEILKTLPEDYESVRKQLYARFLTSALNVMRLCALDHSAEDVLEYEKKAMKVIHKYAFAAKHLSKSDKLSVLLCRIHPRLFMIMYALRRKA